MSFAPSARMALAALAVVLGLPVAHAAADETALRKSARRDATVLCDSFVRGDVELFFKYTHPELIRLMGGRQQAAPQLKQAFDEMRAQHLKVLEVGEVQQLAREGTEVQIILPIRLQLDVPGGQAVMRSHMLGISGNGGTSWTFVDLNKVGDDQGALRRIVPRLSRALKLPAPEAPVVTKR